MIEHRTSVAQAKGWHVLRFVTRSIACFTLLVPTIANWESVLNLLGPGTTLQIRRGAHEKPVSGPIFAGFYRVNVHHTQESRLVERSLAGTHEKKAAENASSGPLPPPP